MVNIPELMNHYQHYSEYQNLTNHYHSIQN